MRLATDLTVALYGIMTVPEREPMPRATAQNFNIYDKKVSHLLIKFDRHILSADLIDHYVSEGQ
jgi:hypothetical protein